MRTASRRPLAIATLAIAVLGAAGVGAVAPAHAATSTLDYTVTTSDPVTSSWPSYLSDCSSFSNWTNGSRNVVQRTASVSVAGDYTFADRMTPGNGYIAVLSGAYDPSDVSNCIVAIDSIANVSLATGTTYTLLLAGHNSEHGDFSFTVDGPGLFASPAKSASTTTLSASPARVSTGDPIELAATITSPAAGIDISGSVEFFADGTSVGTTPVSSAGQATPLVVTLPEGAHTIVAVYSGNADVFSSTSLATQVTVDAIPQLAETGIGSSVTLVAFASATALLAGLTLKLVGRRATRA